MTTTENASRFTLVLLVMLVMLPSAAATAQEVQWTRFQVPADSGPSLRAGHAMAYDAARAVTVLFGGANNGGGFNAETWEWTGEGWNNRTAPGPSARYGAAMAYDTARGVTVLFGGFGGSDAFADTWEWDGTAWIQRPELGPPRRYFHAMAYDSARGVIVIFGGFGGSDRLADTWEWDGSTWTDRTGPGPSARYGAAMAYDATRHVCVLFGGSTNIDRNDETWEWDGTAWTRIQVGGPGPREQHAITFDSARGACVMFGGLDGRLLADTWSWNGSAWVAINGAGPSGRYGHALVFDAGHGSSVLIGGNSADRDASTWGFGPPCTALIAPDPTPAQVCPGGSASFSIGANAVLPARTFQWRKGGMPLTNGGRISGSESPTLSISGVQSLDQGLYDCVVTNLCGSSTSNPAELSCRPIINTQPAPVSILADGLRIAVAVPSCSSYSYRWRYNGTNLFNVPGLFSGATTPTLTIIAGDPSAAGVFDCVLTSPCGTTISDASGVYCPSDFNRDFVVNADDLGDFITGYFNDPADPATDFNGDGVINADDLGDFITSYFNGC